MPPTSLETDLESLFRSPLEGFVARRDELARDSDHSAELAKLRRPTLSAWAVNQAVRAEPAARDALLEAGVGLRAAQTALLGGGDAGAFRRASDALHAAVRRMTELACRIANDAGHPAQSSFMGRVERTFFTSATGSDDDREALRKGRLTEDLVPADPFAHGGLAGGKAPPSAPAKPRRAAAPPPTAASQAKADAAARREAAKVAKLARARAHALRQAAQRALRQAEALDAAALKAEAAAEDSAQHAKQARARAAEAHRVVAQAEHLARDAEGRAAALGVPAP